MWYQCLVGIIRVFSTIVHCFEFHYNILNSIHILSWFSCSFAYGFDLLSWADVLVIICLKLCTNICLLQARNWDCSLLIMFTNSTSSTGLTGLMCVNLFLTGANYSTGSNGLNWLNWINWFNRINCFIWLYVCLCFVLL